MSDSELDSVEVVSSFAEAPAVHVACLDFTDVDAYVAFARDVVARHAWALIASGNTLGQSSNSRLVGRSMKKKCVAITRGMTER